MSEAAQLSPPTDFNDLHATHGLEAVRDQVLATITQGTPPTRLTADFTPLPDQDGQDGQDMPDDQAPLCPPVMSAEGFAPPLLQDVVTLGTDSSEAHPVAVAANFIAFFCSAIGRTAFQRIGDAFVHARPFFLVVGKSGKARKGTAEHLPREVMKRADALLRQRHGTTDRLHVHTGGLSSGEGAAYAIRDPREADEKTGKGGDAGVTDKRLIVIESEFANVLAQVKREGNTLSAIVRNLWDGRDIEPLTKTNQLTVTHPHVVILGHITGHELREKSSANDAANGLLNRFVMLHVHRPKLVPLPQPTGQEKLDALAERMADAIEFVTGGNPGGNNTREVKFSPSANDSWCELYPSVTRDRHGFAGGLMARTEVYCRMLAMVFALLDKRDVVETSDLLAALQWVNYWRESIDFIWREEHAQTELDEFTQEVLHHVNCKPGIKLSELQDVWKRKRTKEVKAALEVLANLAPPLIEMRLDTSGVGRAAQRYYPTVGQ